MCACADVASAAHFFPARRYAAKVPVYSETSSTPLPDPAALRPLVCAVWLALPSEL